MGFAPLFTEPRCAAVFFCRRSSPRECACFQEFISGAMERRMRRSRPQAWLMRFQPQWSIGILRRTAYPTDDCWELVARRGARCAKPMEKSRSVAKEFCCSPCCFQTGYCQKVLEAIPIGARLTGLYAKCPAVFIYLSCRQIQQPFEKAAPTSMDKSREREAPHGLSPLQRAKALFTFLSGRV